MSAMRILESALYAEALEETAAFYAEVMGLERIAEVEGRHVFFRAGEGVLLLFRPSATREPPPPDARLPVPPHGCSGPGHLCFAASAAEIERWRARLTDAGIEIEGGRISSGPKAGARSTSATRPATRSSSPSRGSGGCRASRRDGGGMTTDRIGGPVRYDLGGDVPPEALRRLLDQTDWACGRSTDGIATSLRGSAAVVSAWDGDELVGFARAVGDGVYRALVEDVVVDEAWRGRGVGQELIARLVAQLSSTEEIRLVTRPETTPFYEGCGFERDAAATMRRRVGRT